MPGLGHEVGFLWTGIGFIKLLFQCCGLLFTVYFSKQAICGKGIFSPNHGVHHYQVGCSAVPVIFPGMKNPGFANDKFIQPVGPGGPIEDELMGDPFKIRFSLIFP